jgi:hypothetical protein
MNNHELPLRRSLLATRGRHRYCLCRRAFRRARQCRDTISFEKGVLKVVGDAGNNSFTVGRTPAGSSP